MKGERRKCENPLGGVWVWAGEPSRLTKRAPLTLMRCLLTHLVKVFFCTRSRSSRGDKTSLPGAWEKPRKAPRGESTTQTHSGRLGHTLPDKVPPGPPQALPRSESPRSPQKPPHTDTRDQGTQV